MAGQSVSRRKRSHKRTPSTFYVYMLFRETGIPFYVGKGKRGDRWLLHEREAVPGRSYKDNIIINMRGRCLEVPKVKVAENLTSEQAEEMEIALIAAIGRYPDGPLANLCAGGGGLADPSEETRMKMSKSQRNRDPATFRSEKTLLAAEARRGIPRPPEVIEAIRAANLGRPLSPEHCLKLSIAHKGKPPTAAQLAKWERMKGRTLSAEHRARIGDAHRGVPIGPPSDEARRKISATLTGRKVGPLTDEHRQKIVTTMTGRVYSEERRQAMRDGWAKWRERKAKQLSIGFGESEPDG